MNIILLLSALFIGSLVLTYCTRAIALRKNVIDVPNARSSHSQPTPRGGGIAIVVVWYIGVFSLYIFGAVPTSLLLAFLSGIFLAIISFLDDLYTIKPIYRLLLQMISSGLAVYFLGGLQLNFLEAYPLSLKIIASSVLVVGGVWFINIYNFLDGIDGYASMEAIFVSLALFIFTRSYLPLIVISSTLGFLFWNWPKAKIFMGDVGSTQLGFVLLVLGIYFQNEMRLDFLVWIMLTSLFWFDATYTLFKRWKNNENLSEAHRKHAYQRLVQSGMSHLQALIILMSVNILIFAITYFSGSELLMKIILLLSILIILFIGYRQVDKLVPFN